MFFVNIEQAKQRYQICKSCEQFNSLLKTCNQCRCFMPAKVTIGKKKCPLLKWNVTSSDPSVSTHYILEE